MPSNEEIARTIVVSACNEARNSDIRADHPYIRHAISAALDVKDMEHRAVMEVASEQREELESEIDSLSAKLAEREAALRELMIYADHGCICPAMEGGKCNCGLDAALTRSAKALEASQ